MPSRTAKPKVGAGVRDASAALLAAVIGRSKADVLDAMDGGRITELAVTTTATGESRVSFTVTEPRPK